MRITIELPDALAAEAQEFAHEQRTTLRELIIAGLRSEMDRQRKPSTPAGFHFPTAGGNGLTSGIEPNEIVDLSYGLR